MKKTTVKIALSLILSVAAAVNIASLTPLGVATDTEKKVDTVFEFEKEGYNNALNKILAEDGFIYGIADCKMKMQ